MNSFRNCFWSTAWLFGTPPGVAEAVTFWRSVLETPPRLIDILRSRSSISFARAHRYPSLALIDILRSRSSISFARAHARRLSPPLAAGVSVVAGAAAATEGDDGWRGPGSSGAG